jgi:hypothetical protein
LDWGWIKSPQRSRYVVALKAKDARGTERMSPSREETFSGKGLTRERLRTVKKQIGEVTPKKLFPTARKERNPYSSPAALMQIN